MRTRNRTLSIVVSYMLPMYIESLRSECGQKINELREKGKCCVFNKFQQNTCHQRFVCFKMISFDKVQCDE